MAPGSPPETGASRVRTPAFPAASAMRNSLCGRIVLNVYKQQSRRGIRENALLTWHGRAAIKVSPLFTGPGRGG